jgi:Fe-S oxidoreductase
MCQACVQECPVLIGHVDLISDMRRDLIGEGKLSGPPARSLQQIGNQANPYGRPNADRLAWAEGLDVPTVESNPDFEYLFLGRLRGFLRSPSAKGGAGNCGVTQKSRSEFCGARKRGELHRRSGPADRG